MEEGEVNPKDYDKYKLHPSDREERIFPPRVQAQYGALVSATPLLFSVNIDDRNCVARLS
jgi:hypothetical protein